MVPCSRSFTGLVQIFLPHRCVVNRLHYGGNGNKKAIVSRRFGNRSAVPYFSVCLSVSSAINISNYYISFALN